MPRPLALLVLSALLSPVACDRGTAVESDPNKCTTSKQCPEGNTCYGSRCMTHDEMLAREAELAAKQPTPQATSQPPPAGAPAREPEVATPAPSKGRAPAFDTAAHCESVSQMAGGSFVIKRQCESDEERARKAIAARATPDRIYDHCDDVARMVGGSYTIMEQCIKDELAAAAEVPAGSLQLGPGPVPSFDIEKYCEKVSQTVGGSFTIKRTCEDQENSAKIALSHLQIPPRVYKTCHRTAKVVGGSFEIMKVCVEQELDAMVGG